MSKEKNSKTHNIFLMDNAKLKASFINDNDTTISECISNIMNEHQDYIPQKLKEQIETKGFSISLYFRPEHNPNSKFISFCKSFVEDGQSALSFSPQSSSSILFVWNEKRIYAITTGQGFRIIENYAVPKFGLLIASAFEKRFKITSLDSNAVSSIIHSSKTIYSNEVDFIDIESLDTIFKEVTGRLKDVTTVHKLLNLSSNSKKKSMKVTAKNFLQFSSSLSFDGLLHLLSIIDEYEIESLSDKFNLIIPMNTKKNDGIITENNAAVIHLIYEAIKSKSEIPFDLFHKETAEFISADTYIISNSKATKEYTIQDDYTATELISSAFDAFLEGEAPTETAFYSFFTDTLLYSKLGDDNKTKGTLLQHVSGEICVRGVNYYVFYGEYYRLNSSYNERLNVSLSGKLHKDIFTSEITTKWSDGKNEDDFNRNASTHEKYAHLHKIKPDYIEFADLLKCDGNTITVVHVKDGFDGDMRILDRQVELSIAKIMDLKHNNNDLYMRQLYNNASISTTGTNIKEIFPTVDEFLDSMKTKQIRYIIAIRPAKDNLLECQSNIAKHCLNAMIYRCFNQGLPLNIQLLK
jgi:uncharacterized protein (TIGR04141 family)